MSKKDGSNRRARYTVEFKLEAVRLVKAAQEASVTAVAGVSDASAASLSASKDSPGTASRTAQALRHALSLSAWLYSGRWPTLTTAASGVGT